MKSVIWILIISFFSLIATAQSSYYDFGAGSKGIGNSNSTLADEWSIFNNVGGITGVEGGVVFFGYDQFATVAGFDKIAAGAIHSLSFGNLGVSVFSFGDNLFSERTASVAFGNKVGFVRLGARANYYQIRIDEFGTSGAFFFDFGGIVELVPELSFGAFISNFSLSKLNNAEKSELPVVMKIGLSYNPTDYLKFNLDLCKDIIYKPIIKVGLEYFVARKIYLRTGLNTNPFKNFFGIGFVFNRFKLDYAMSHYDFLGFSHQLGISFKYYKEGGK